MGNNSLSIPFHPVRPSFRSRPQIPFVTFSLLSENYDGGVERQDLDFSSHIHRHGKNNTKGCWLLAMNECGEFLPVHQRQSPAEVQWVRVQQIYVKISVDLDIMEEDEKEKPECDEEMMMIRDLHCSETCERFARKEGIKSRLAKSWEFYTETKSNPLICARVFSFNKWKRSEAIQVLFLVPMGISISLREEKGVSEKKVDWFRHLSPPPLLSCE